MMITHENSTMKNTINTKNKGLVVNGVKYIGSRILYNDVCVGILRDMVDDATTRSFISKDYINGDVVNLFILESKIIVCDRNTGKQVLIKNIQEIQRTICLKDRQVFGLVVNNNGRLIVHGFVTKCSTQVNDINRFYKMVFN